AHRPVITRENLAQLAQGLSASNLDPSVSSVREQQVVGEGAEPWILDKDGRIALIRRLEQEYPELEEVGCKVGIGVATGADSAFIGNYHALDVEADRKLKLVTTRDIASGEVSWQGLGVI